MDVLCHSRWKTCVPLVNGIFILRIVHGKRAWKALKAVVDDVAMFSAAQAEVVHKFHCRCVLNIFLVVDDIRD